MRNVLFAMCLCFAACSGECGGCDSSPHADGGVAGSAGGAGSAGSDSDAGSDTDAGE